MSVRESGGLTAGPKENRPRPDRLLINGSLDRLVMKLFAITVNHVLKKKPANGIYMIWFWY